MKSGIYMIINQVTGKSYIGQSVNVPQRLSRHKSHLTKNKHHNSHLQNAWNKYGKDSFKFNVLEFCDEDSLDDNEIFWIDYFDSTNPVKGYNLESGGRANRTVSRETRKKLSNLMKGNKIWLGRNHSEETKKKISEGNKGRIFSKETLRKFSEVNSGENNPNYGKQYSLYERVKLSKAQNNSTGFYRVSKKRKKSCKNGFTFEYSYYEGTRRKFLSSISLLKLKEKVLGKGLDWCVIDEDLARQTLENELGVQS